MPSAHWYPRPDNQQEQNSRKPFPTAIDQLSSSCLPEEQEESCIPILPCSEEDWIHHCPPSHWKSPPPGQSDDEHDPLDRTSRARYSHNYMSDSDTEAKLMETDA
ncbi:Myosin-XVIIIa [Fukomys damarensis]|uniref:Myosin-XVIIIa n=1 Tax=Fukomys damarensis TaxID=885580 RepID=A0A091D5L0_FUKDA|nr:Myosin-XVIIIa [Fukomys damarensis]